MPVFIKLWENHPTITDEGSLLDRKQYANQCAVKLYAALQRSGTNTRTFTGQLSWQKGGPKYAIRAQELADWLASPANPVQSKVERYSGKEVFEKIASRIGIIFFKNYWGTGSQGDHIDLWNGSRLTDWRTWALIHIRIGEYGLQNLSSRADLRAAESVWFWPIN